MSNGLAVTSTVDGWLTLLAAAIALAASYTTLELSAHLPARSRARALCQAACGAAVLGVALGCLHLIGLLAPGATSAAGADVPGLIAALGLAVLGQAGLFAVFAGRAPGTGGLLAASAAAAIGICASYLATAAALGAPLPAGGFPALADSAALAAAAWTGALWLRSRPGRDPAAGGWVVPSRILAVLMGAVAMLGPHAERLLHGRSAFGPFGHGAAGSAELLGVALGAIALEVIAVTQVALNYEQRLSLRRGQSARELDEVHTRLQYLATHDSLTGLPNWLLFRERLAQAVADTGRPGRAIAVAVFDLDHFSALNHSLGHGAGDWLLAEVARRVGSVMRPGQMLARLGSDEFVVLIDSVAARIDAEHLTRDILAALREPIAINGTDVHVRPSIGVSVWPDDGRRVDDLLAHAEVAMAAAKRRGGQAQFFEHGMTDSMHERLALENDLRRGLAAGEFELWFQPVISAKSGRIVSAEALLRWRHPRRGVIGPSSFIPLAEETGLMIPLGEWVLREVCRRAAEWQQLHGEPMRLAVNLSATQFRHQNLVELIRCSLEAARVDATSLEIELTESAVMTNPEESVGVLRQLQRMGITVAVDDFGTGYSSLSYLRRFPIDKLKIDRSFVRDLATSRTDESIVRAIISLAHSVDLLVVAEGVETEEQLRCVHALGCDQWQGYYCCEPQRAEVFGEMLAGQAAGTRTALVTALGRVSRG
jgi:diguanylate cyclase